MRSWMLLATLLAGLTTCSKRSPPTTPPELGLSDAERAAAESELADWRQRKWPRPPLLRPAGGAARDCRAGDRYQAAAELVTQHRESLALDRALWRPNRWHDLDPAVAEVLTSPFATAVAEAVLAGAECSDGTGSTNTLPWEGDPELELVHLAQAATMIALEWADDGRPVDAGYLLVAVMQLGYDLARPGDLLHLEIGWTVAGYPLAPLDQVAGKLDAAGLDEIAEACRLVIDAAPSYLDILRGERMAATALVLWFAAEGKAKERELSPKETLASLRAVGGSRGYLQRFDQMVGALAGIDDRPLPAALEEIARVAKVVGWSDGLFDPGQFLPRHRVGLSAARAHQVALAIRAERLRGGSWPADLSSLGDLATDPRTGEPFGYVVGKAVRGEPVACGERAGCDSAVEAALE